MFGHLVADCPNKKKGKSKEDKEGKTTTFKKNNKGLDDSPLALLRSSDDQHRLIIIDNENFY